MAQELVKAQDPCDQAKILVTQNTIALTTTMVFCY
jgi:hypothetical protein